MASKQRKYIRYDDKHLYEHIPADEAVADLVNQQQMTVYNSARHAYTGSATFPNITTSFQSHTSVEYYQSL